MEVAKRHLKVFQVELHRLYTEERYRKSFFQKPKVVLRNIPEDSEEYKMLVNLDAREVEMYAQSLLKKRLGIVKSLIPQFFEETGKEGDEMYLRYAADHPLKKQNKFSVDCIQFLSWIISPGELPEEVERLVKTMRVHLRFQRHRFGIKVGTIFYDLAVGRDYLTNEYVLRKKLLIQIRLGKLLLRNF